MSTERLIPIVGCWVRKSGIKEPGIVRSHVVIDDKVHCRVEWLQSRKNEDIPPQNLGCGFPLNIEVQDVPTSRTRNSLGEGVVIETRRLGHRAQVLVEFPEQGERLWLPFENLKQIKGIRQRFELGQVGQPGNSERFRLRSLAHAIEMGMKIPVLFLILTLILFPTRFIWFIIF